MAGDAGADPSGQVIDLAAELREPGETRSGELRLDRAVPAQAPAERGPVVR